MINFLQRICLMRRPNHSQGLKPPPSGTPLAVSGCGQVILIVDLDGQNGQLLAKALEEAGFEPRVARRDSTALEMLGDLDPAVVIVAGPANPNFYRALRQAVSAPILALAPQADDAQALEAFAAGVDQFQSGPISPTEVVARVVALLRRAT